jgi:prenyl protein peptidase
MAGGDVGEGEGGGERRMVGGSSGRPSILWSVAYYVLLVAGAVVWYRNLWVLSESGNALVPSEAFGRATA